MRDCTKKLENPFELYMIGTTIEGFDIIRGNKRSRAVSTNFIVSLSVFPTYVAKIST